MSSNTSGTSQKRPATARMHALSPRKKPRTTPSVLTSALDPTPAGAWIVKANAGDCPPYTDHAGWIEDPIKNMVYMFGGTYPGDPNLLPTSYFFQCDIKTMKWENLTDKLRFRDPSDPFGPVELRRKEQQLPCLGQPGLALFRIRDTSFIFVFGGYSLEESLPVSTLIAIDLDHREWWYVHVHGGPVPGRIKPVVVNVQNRLYIFGGDGRYNERNPQSFRSYSILAYKPDFRHWTWEAIDTPYPNFIPPDQVFGAGLAVYSGKKIMLTPGKPLCHDNPLNFTEQKIFYFHTEHRQFQMAPHLGDYPKEVLWYSIHKFASPFPPCPASLPSPSYKGLGRLPKRGPGSSRATGITSPIASTSPSVILCAWVPRPNSHYAMPELWRLSLSHNDEIRCLNKSKQIWDLNHDFQGCVVVDDRIILLGNNNPKDELETWNIHVRVVLSPEDQADKSQD